jgi:CRISPR-associated protein Cas2
MSDATWHLVSYDIRVPKRLRRAARLMEGYGQRVQYSVFRCWVTKAALERLRWELTALLDPSDAVLLIPLCGKCVDRIVGIHGSSRPPDWPDEPERHKIV